TSTIPSPLLDRMEILELPGYTESEKVQIAKRFLVPHQRAGNGLRDGEATISDEALVTLIRGYSREAGVRELEREIACVFRKTARHIAEGAAGAPFTIDTPAL